MKFNHVGISVADLDRSISFYEGMFGMTQLCEPFPFNGEWYTRIMGVPDPKGRMVMMGRGNLQLELFEFAHPEPTPKDANYPVSDHGISHFGLEIDDIDEMHDRLRAAGVRFHCQVQQFNGGIKATYGRDPDGNVFELLEMPKDRA